MNPYPHLSKPLQLRNVTLRNRIFMGPHQSQLGFSDGLPQQNLADYLVARAAGGAAMLIVEAGVTRANSLRERTVLRAYVPEASERWKPIVAAVHAQGARIVGQFIHSGRQASGYSNPDEPLWAPSPIACPVFREFPKEMELEDIEACLDSYVVCTRNMRLGELDGVEVQCCHGYLLNEFLSPYTNKRTDEYGGSLENRMRLLMQTLERCRSELGADRILGVRLESTELVPGGLDLDETSIVAKAIEKTGWVDYLSISQGVRESVEMIRAPMFVPAGYAADWTAVIKRAVSLPVFATARMPHPDVAEGVLALGKADGVVLARELIADPEYPNKALEGRAEEIRRCVAALDCVFNVGSARPLKCIYNAEIGKEGEKRLTASPKRRKVVVVGGGPAGLETARVASARGHQVVLFEAGDAIGGELRWAAQAPGRGELGNMLQYYEVQLKKLKVDVRLNARASLQSVLAEKADAVVIATGAIPLLPPSPLLPALKLEPGATIISYLEALERPWREGEHVVLFDGEFHGLAMSVAEVLAGKNVKVSFLTEIEKPGIRLDAATQKMWFRRLGKLGVTLAPFRRLIGASAEGAQIKHLHSDAVEWLKCDAIVYAYARRANDSLYKELKQAKVNVRAAGDCLAPRSAMFAVNDGFEAASAI